MACRNRKRPGCPSAINHIGTPALLFYSDVGFPKGTIFGSENGPDRPVSFGRSGGSFSESTRTVYIFRTGSTTMIPKPSSKASIGKDICSAAHSIDGRAQADASIVNITISPMFTSCSCRTEAHPPRGPLDRWPHASRRINCQCNRFPVSASRSAGRTAKHTEAGRIFLQDSLVRSKLKRKAPLPGPQAKTD